MDVIEVAPGRPAIACALADDEEVRVNTNVQLVLDCGAIPLSPVKLGVSVDTGVVGSAAASPPDVAADAVHVKAKKIETINVAIIVFFMLENLLFAPIDITLLSTHLADFEINI